MELNVVLRYNFSF